jgi:hypothetical protein
MVMLRFMTIGLAAMVVSLSVACSSTNVTGVAVPNRDTADVQLPTTGSDVMDVQLPTTGSDVMKASSDVQLPTTGSDVMNVQLPTTGSDVMSTKP